MRGKVLVAGGYRGGFCEKLLEASPCGGLSLAGGQVPTRAALSLPSFTKQGRKGITKCLWVEIRTGRDHSLIIVTSKTD